MANGDEKAFSSLFDKFFPRLYAFCLKYLNDTEEARDIAQETFVKIWEKRGDIDPAKPFPTYLMAIAKNRIYNYIKQKIVAEKHRSKITAPRWELFYEEDKPLWDEVFDLVFSAVEQLPPGRREIMMLRIQGLSNPEISERLNLSVRTVENQYSRALATLRTMIPADISLALLMFFFNN